MANDQPAPKRAPYRPYQPTTGQPCSCKRGVQRDNCVRCEGTGMVIDYRAIHDQKATAGGTTEGGTT